MGTGLVVVVGLRWVYFLDNRPAGFACVFKRGDPRSRIQHQMLTYFLRWCSEVDSHWNCFRVVSTLTLQDPMAIDTVHCALRCNLRGRLHHPERDSREARVPLYVKGRSSPS
jgi:hypothetical protein